MMGKILLTKYYSPKKLTTIIMLYKNTKAKVCSPNGNTDIFDLITGVLQINTLAPYLFIIYLDYMLQMLIDIINENGFKFKKRKKQIIS